MARKIEVLAGLEGIFTNRIEADLAGANVAEQPGVEDVPTPSMSEVSGGLGHGEGATRSPTSRWHGPHFPALAEEANWHPQKPAVEIASISIQPADLLASRDYQTPDLNESDVYMSSTAMDVSASVVACGVSYGGFKLVGEGSGDYFGISVSDAGDMNNDGLADIAVSARFNDGGGNWSGAGYVVFGDASLDGATLNVGGLDGSNGFKFTGYAGDQTGLAISTAGDVNGDGIADMIVGANDALGRRGSAYIIYGSDDPFPAEIRPGDLDGTNGTWIEGYHGLAGAYLSDAGDINGDGYDDVIVSEYRAIGDTGVAYVVFGGPSIGATITLGMLDGTDGFKMTGVNYDDATGIGVESLGDINGDGLDDIIVGAPDAGPGRYGVSYVIYGSTDPFAANIDLDDIDGANGYVVSGASSNQAFGASNDGLGDINGDGYNDFAVTDLIADPMGRANAGATYVIYGTGSDLPANIDIGALGPSEGLTIIGASAGDNAGTDVSAAGDVNGDGIDDFLIGARYADPNGRSNAGEAYLIFGSDTGLPSTIDLATLDGTNGYVIGGELANDWLGSSVSSAGDLNDDGVDDIILGATGQYLGSSTGQAYVIYGGAYLAALDAVDGATDGRIDVSNYDTAINLPPVAQDDAADVAEDGQTLNLWDHILSNDTDTEGDPLTIVSVDTTGTLGTVMFDDVAQTIVFVADDDALDSLAPGETQVTSFDYTVTDCVGNTDTATVSVTVHGVVEPTHGGRKIKGTPDPDLLQGTEANEQIIGLSSDDLINGGGGNDRLTGNNGCDTFEFHLNSGNDTVLDLKEGEDVIDARGVLGVTTHEEVIAFFDTNMDGYVDDSDANSYWAKGALVLEFDGDGVDGNGPNAVSLQGIHNLSIENFDNLYWM